MRASLLAVLLATAAAGAGCAEGDPGAGGDVESLGALVPAPTGVELAEAGACPDGTLWAADDDGALVVRIARAAGGAPGEGVVPLPADAVVVTGAVGAEPCAPARDGSPATRGRLAVACADDGLTVRLDGLVLEDGTTVAPSTALPTAVGC